MKKILICCLSMVNMCTFAKYNLLDLCTITKAGPVEIRNAMNYLDQLERDFDADWRIYHGILPRIINERNYKIGCEIGVSFGTHCKKILQTTTIQKLYGIDPYLNYGDPTNTQMSDLWFEIFYNKVVDKLSVFSERFELIRDFSVNAARRFADNSLDFIFLDANHTFEAVTQDLHTWFDKVRPGGIMSGDDYATCHPGVPAAVNLFCSQKGLQVHTDADQPRFWWFEKG